MAECTPVIAKRLPVRKLKPGQIITGLMFDDFRIQSIDYHSDDVTLRLQRAREPASLNIAKTCLMLNVSDNLDMLFSVLIEQDSKCDPKWDSKCDHKWVNSISPFDGKPYAYCYDCGLHK